MDCLAPVTHVYKCRMCGFGSCLGSEVAAIDRRVKERVDGALAEMRVHAKTLQRVQRDMRSELETMAGARLVDGANCPACGLALTRAPKSRWLDCAACGDRISVEWAGKYAQELDRLRRLVVEAGKLRTAAAQVDAAAQAIERKQESNREV